ncbi:uncharacterized protein PAC_12817 [Phialocephala subalpina]|uniref:Uncharacterized protein n=1 Tax=Phialocephala subalpina TaxID=576137 RepID=A0A1L7XD01_9HELO|nr:uncharacterized protein PAC_12817 [Phialocephala subalpina]
MSDSDSNISTATQRKKQDVVCTYDIVYESRSDEPRPTWGYRGNKMTFCLASSSELGPSLDKGEEDEEVKGEKAGGEKVERKKGKEENIGSAEAVQRCKAYLLMSTWEEDCHGTWYCTPNNNNKSFHSFKLKHISNSFQDLLPYHGEHDQERFEFTNFLDDKGYPLMQFSIIVEDESQYFRIRGWAKRRVDGVESNDEGWEGTGGKKGMKTRLTKAERKRVRENVLELQSSESDMGESGDESESGEEKEGDHDIADSDEEEAFEGVNTPDL